MKSSIFKSGVHISGNTDYDSVTESLTLSFGAQRECINITIRDNAVVENNRIFSVVLSTTDQRLVLGIDMSEVLIRDDDSEPDFEWKPFPSVYVPNLHLPFFAAVVANIPQTSILASEASGAASVCVSISEEVARELTFVVTPNADGTATGIKACVAYHACNHTIIYACRSG